MTTEVEDAAVTATPMSNGGGSSSWMEQTQYIARTIYEDPTIGPIAMDLHSACAMGKYECVNDAINRADNLSGRNKGGWTPLMYASYVGHDTVVNLLLDAHVDPNIGTPTGLTPLMVAAGCGNESVCYFLIQNGAEIDQEDDSGWTALYHATKQGHQATVQLLLKEGANMEIGDTLNGYTPLMIAAMEGDQIVLDVLIACQADINAKAKDGHTARSLALHHNHIKTVSFLDEVRMMYQNRAGSTDSFESDLPSVSSYPDTDDDLQSGPEEVDQMTRKAIQKRLGHRGGPRWSLPPEHIGQPRASITNSTTTRRLKFRPSRSMPESDVPYDEDDEDTLGNSHDSHEDNMAKLMELLEEIGLQRYYEVFESNEIDFYALLELSDDELKKVIDKLGPRKKLKMAIVKVKEEIQKQEAEASKAQTETTPTHQNDIKSQLNLLNAKHQQALQSLESCERRLAKEHELRVMAERYCQELQQCRAQALKASKTLRDTINDVLGHCQSLTNLHTKLVREVRNNSSHGDKSVSSSLSQLEGMIQAVHRASHQANKDCKTVHYQLNVLSS